MSSSISEEVYRARLVAVGEMIGRVGGMVNNSFKTCLNCANFVEGPPDRSGERCGLNNMMPPPSIAARGCDKWEDEIPF
jgi:hypothetical protein